MPALFSVPFPMLPRPVIQVPGNRLRAFVDGLCAAFRCELRLVVGSALDKHVEVGEPEAGVAGDLKNKSKTEKRNKKDQKSKR